MDPNQNLQKQLEEAARILEILDAQAEHVSVPEAIEEVIGRASRLAELVQGLDGWISGGGFLPRQWARK